MSSKQNGCRPGGVIGKIIPDTLIGVSVHEACNLHDLNYSIGGDTNDRKIADETFISDMLKAVEKNSKNSIGKNIRTIQAYLYYWSVRFFGTLFFHNRQ
jgi:hypothetical protein